MFLEKINDISNIVFNKHLDLNVDSSTESITANDFLERAQSDETCKGKCNSLVEAALESLNETN